MNKSMKQKSPNKLEELIEEITDDDLKEAEATLEKRNEIERITNIVLDVLGIEVRRGIVEAVIEQYEEQIKKLIDIKIVEVDERMSTVTAQNALLSFDVSRKKRKQVVDKVAATVILQSYLDRKPRMF